MSGSTGNMALVLALSLAVLGAVSYGGQVLAEALQITAPPDKTFEAQARIMYLGDKIGTATATSNSTEPIKITNDAPRLYSLGTVIVRWTAEVGGGNGNGHTENNDSRHARPCHESQLLRQI